MDMFWEKNEAFLTAKLRFAWIGDYLLCGQPQTAKLSLGKNKDSHKLHYLLLLIAKDTFHIR